MRFTVFVYYATGVIGLCAALPIPSVSVENRNAFLLGALAFASFGAILAGCICCRRRKQGFEEFKNESGTLENNKIEYPIFRALSPENQRNVPAANDGMAIMNNSNENLIVDDFDNNNGPISPSDLENIENNNAVDYIRNQNEIHIEIENSPYNINQNIVMGVCHENFQQSQEVQSFVSNFPGNETQEQEENFTIYVESNSVCNDVESTIEVHSLYDPNCLNKTVAIYEKEVPIQNSNSIFFQNLSQQSESKTTQIKDDESFIPTEISLEKDILLGNESSSLKSSSSDRSTEINSVEEALRALDSVIAREELYSHGCEEDSDLVDEDFECNNTNFQNVIRQLLINNGVNSFLPDLRDGQVNLNINDDNLEYIRTEAKLLVESIITESQKVACDRISSLNDVLEEVLPKSSDMTINMNSSSPVNIDCAALDDKITTNLKTDIDPYQPHEPELLEDFFCKQMIGTTSTPCIENKYGEHISKTVNKKIVQNLFDIVEVKNQKDNLINISFTNDETQILPNNDNFDKSLSPINNQTFDKNQTYEVNATEDNNIEFVHPGDPCTSKQAIERDYVYPLIKYEKDEINSEDLTTITPLNTPIELNYSHDTWDKMTKNATRLSYEIPNKDSDQDYEAEGNSWFLHPQPNTEVNETFDVEEDEANLELTFEALRKQLAEVLPQPQSMSGPPDYSDDEDEQQNNRTFDEYRSPLDGLVDLLDAETSTPAPVQNELFINYKRPLSPIIEESEDETYKTFVLNETKCLDSTSTGCVDTGEAIMGVTKTLMASNDTLFNFEDTLGDKEDVFSPRVPSRNETQVNTPNKSGKSTEENSLATATGSETIEKSEQMLGLISGQTNLTLERKSPPKSIDIIETFGSFQDGELCSPEQQKTFSDGTSSNTDHPSSDISANHDTTFTTNTIDDKTCITVIIKDDERISEISEPEWGSTASYGGYEMNSLTDVPSLDFNTNKSMNAEDNEMEHMQDSCEIKEKIGLSSIFDVSYEYEKDIGHDDSGHSTQVSIAEKSTSNLSESETQPYEENNTNISTNKEENPSNFQHNENTREACQTFIRNEIKFSSQIMNGKFTTLILPENDIDSAKENANPNVNVILTNSIEFDKITCQKVQNNSQDAVIIDKSKNISSSDLCENESTTRITENIFNNPEITILPIKHQQTITNYSVNDVKGAQNEQHCLVVADEILGHLSGEEDPWAEPLHDIRFTGPCEMITSFTVNEWESDVDDSHSSEEFMYVRGALTKDDNSEMTSNQLEKSDSEIGYTAFDETFEPHMWSSHEDKIPVGGKKIGEEEVSEESSSEFEGEFVPSCWDSMATPGRSALKSPDKSSSDKRKRRSVAFKKQRYHSVYEYPRENTSLSPAYSEPFLWNKNSSKSLYSDEECTEEFNDGFVVSSSMRPFHGSQFNALCHTWPTDSDFSWSQVETLEGVQDESKLVTYSDIDIKWPQTLNSICIEDYDAKNNEKKKSFEKGRPDSGVGESAEKLNDRISLGELRHTKSNLRLPLELKPATKPIIIPDTETTDKTNETLKDTIILPTPSCTGSMDSLSSSSGSERQVRFSTFGKPKAFNENDKLFNIEINDHLRSALVLIENQPIENIACTDKIKQSDSTDEDSGIESIMKINKESD